MIEKLLAFVHELPALKPFRTAHKYKRDRNFTNSSSVEIKRTID